MFVVAVSFPPIKTGKEADFEKWFAWSNNKFSTFKRLYPAEALEAFGGWQLRRHRRV